MPKTDDPFIMSDRLVAPSRSGYFAAAQQPVAGPYSLKTRRVWFVPHPCPNIVPVRGTLNVIADHGDTRLGGSRITSSRSRWVPSGVLRRAGAPPSERQTSLTR
jgi:hypothetical protein